MGLKFNPFTGNFDFVGSSGGGGGDVTSVNGQTGAVSLDANDVGADPAGTAQTLFDTIGDKYVRSTRFEIIGSGTSGTVTLPTDSTVVLDDFGGTVDAVVTQVSGGKPTLLAAKTAADAVVATTFDSSGNWSFTGTPSSYPVAIVYRVQQELQNFDSDAANIWGNVNVDNGLVESVNGQQGDVVLDKSDIGLGSVDNTSDLDKPISTATQSALDTKQNSLGYTAENVANKSTSTSLGTSDTLYPTQNAVKTYVDTLSATKITGPASVSDNRLVRFDGTTGKLVQQASGVVVEDTNDITITGNNGVEFAGIKVNNTNVAGFSAVNARADDGEVIQIAALNSGGAANEFGMWLANQFGLYAKRTLNIITNDPTAEIKFSPGDTATQAGKFASDGSFSAIQDFLYGTGEDGDVTISSNTPLARSTYYEDLTIASSGILRVAGFPVYVRGVLTVNAGGIISNNGNTGGNGGASATAGTAGTALSANELGGSTAGGVGATGVNGAGAQAANVASAISLVSATAGSGGAGGAGAGGAAGAARNGSASNYRPTNIVPGSPTFLSSATQKNASQSAPGGSSGAGTGSAAGAGGGGGGSGAGFVLIYCKELINNGSIQAVGGNGGNGGNASNVNAGGGGGGGGGTGGLVVIIAGKVTNLGTINVSGGVGGAAGTGNGTGSNGNAGTSGGSGKYRVYEMSTGTWTIS